MVVGAKANFLREKFLNPLHQKSRLGMATKTASRWADNEEDVALEAQRKKEKESKKRAKAERQRQLDDAQKRREAEVEAANGTTDGAEKESERPTKRRRLSIEQEVEEKREDQAGRLLRFPALEWGPCRHVDNFEKLNHIEEGSYGWVSRARETATGEIVALKKLKMDSNDGFPVTGLREIQTLTNSKHPNIVNLREVVMGDTGNE